MIEASSDQVSYKCLPSQEGKLEIRIQGFWLQI